MTGKYWSSGIRLRYRGEREPTWAGSLDFTDDGYDDDSSVPISSAGQLRSRYRVGADGDHRRALGWVISTLRRDAHRVGVEFRDPYLYVEGAGQGPDRPMPYGWPELIEEQADLLGWAMPRYDSTGD